MIKKCYVIVQQQQQHNKQKVYVKLSNIYATILTFLVVSFLAEVDDDLGGARVEGVEVGPMFTVQTLQGEVIDTSETLH